LSAETINIQQQIKEVSKKWRELWYAMADGDAKQYEIIKALDTFEFWSMYDNWKTRIDAKREALKKH